MAILSVPNALTTSCRKQSISLSTALRTSKYTDDDSQPLCSVECTRKATAEEFPRNFALIRLTERTLDRQRKLEEEKAKAQDEKDKSDNPFAKSPEEEIAELQQQIA